MKLAGLMFASVIFGILILGSVMGAAVASCTEESEAAVVQDVAGYSPGSLGGVLGTGVTRAELDRARAHPLGGTQIVEHEYRSTAYAPAAGGINCDAGGSCESTASGIRVDKGRRAAYLIASNPRMNKYGALVYAWPNPFNWRGPFVVADTGGNFDGSDGTYRIDFYVWGARGLSVANNWGNARMVKLSKRPIVGQAGARVNASEVRQSSSRKTSNLDVRTSVRAGSVRMTRPTTGPMTSPFGPRWGRLHAGVDIAPAAGTPIVAALDGVVDFKGWMNGYGNFTCIVHAANLTTCYAHQSAFARGLAKGHVVQAGQLIGYVGNTGNSTGAHLHFEVRKGRGFSGTPTDPAPYLSGAESVIPSDPTTLDASNPECANQLESDEGVVGEGADGVKRAAQLLERRRIPYCYGGGHGLTPTKPTGGQYCVGEDHQRIPGSAAKGLDCSSSVSWVLQRAGVNVTTMTSGQFASWGKPGPGKRVSIYTNASHIFMVIDGQTFQTSTANYRNGPGFTPSRSTAGWTVRHPEGM